MIDCDYYHQPVLPKHACSRQFTHDECSKEWHNRYDDGKCVKCGKKDMHADFECVECNETGAGYNGFSGP